MQSEHGWQRNLDLCNLVNTQYSRTLKKVFFSTFKKCDVQVACSQGYKLFSKLTKDELILAKTILIFQTLLSTYTVPHSIEFSSSYLDLKTFMSTNISVTPRSFVCCFNYLDLYGVQSLAILLPKYCLTIVCRVTLKVH